MKTSTLHSLMTAKVLFTEAAKYSRSGDRHMCSAGLLMLQDALEIVFLAILTELGVDERKSLESKSFDELVGELKGAGIVVPKSGTLKALNKQRVITKHYGQLAEPGTVLVYLEAADQVLEAVLPQVIGKRFDEIFLTELMSEGEAKQLLASAAALIDKGEYLNALIEVRKAIYVEIEIEYDVHNWADAEPNQGYGLLSIMRGGMKARYWMRNKKWISENVKDPTDYVQIDHEQLRLDAMEWGVSTAELENLRRLTPAVFRFDKDARWQTSYALEFPANEATLPNARYCLDRAVSILIRKQQHQAARRWPSKNATFQPPAIYLDAPVYESARQDSPIVHRITTGFTYTTQSVVSGFNPDERYYVISGHTDAKVLSLEGWFHGYLLVQDEA